MFLWRRALHVLLLLLLLLLGACMR